MKLRPSDLVTKAMTVAINTQAAPMPRRKVNPQFVTTVVSVEEPNPHYRRVRLAAPEFADFDILGPDEFFGLIMPPTGGQLVMPDSTTYNVRTAVAKIPQHERPQLRWYSIAAHDPLAEQVTVDIVTHGDSGPGSAWALRAKAGHTVGFRAGGACYAPHSTWQRQLLVADESALPALNAILAHSEVPFDPTVIVEVPEESFVDGLGLDTSEANIVTLYRGEQPPGSVVLEYVSARPEHTKDLDFAWVCGESSLATGLRRHLVKECGMDKKRVAFSGYWKLGQARG